MDSIGPESYDLVIACDVLEHVADDKLALREIFRILKPGGCVILTVPQKDHAAETYEDNSIVDPAERKRAYGTADHLRIYGSDFADRMESAGFQVAVSDANSFQEQTARRFVLRPPKLSAHPLATNYRKVYFGRKN
jgi:predicted SAM-dependent methyltransferase